MFITYEKFKEIIIADMGAFAEENTPPSDMSDFCTESEESYGYEVSTSGYKFSSPKCPYAYTYDFYEDPDRRWMYHGARGVEGYGESLSAAQDDESKNYMKTYHHLA